MGEGTERLLSPAVQPPSFLTGFSSSGPKALLIFFSLFLSAFEFAAPHSVVSQSREGYQGSREKNMKGFEGKRAYFRQTVPLLR